MVEVESYCRERRAIGRVIEAMPPIGFSQSSPKAQQDF